MPATIVTRSLLRQGRFKMCPGWIAAHCSKGTASGTDTSELATTESGTDENGVPVPQQAAAKASGDAGVIQTVATVAKASTTQSTKPDLTTNEDTPGTTDSVLKNDSDSVKSYDTTSAHGGSVVYNDNGTFTYTPAANFNGTDSFSYTVQDKDGNTTTGTISIGVNSVNDAPTAVNDSASTVQFDDVNIDVLSNDSDVDGDSLSVSSFDSTSAKGGTVTKNADGTLSYEPKEGFSGTDSFNVTVDDGNGGKTTSKVTVNVEPFSVNQNRLGKLDIGAALRAAGAQLSAAKSDLRQSQLALLQAGDEDENPQVQVQIQQGEAHIVNRPPSGDVEDQNTVAYDNLNPVQQLNRLTEENVDVRATEPSSSSIETVGSQLSSEPIEIPESVLESFQEHLNRLEEAIEENQVDAQYDREEVRDEQDVEVDEQNDVTVQNNEQIEQQRLERQAQEFVATLLEVNGVKLDTPVFNDENSQRPLSESGAFF